MAQDHSPPLQHVPNERRSVPESHEHIAGWGADLQPSDRPAFPMERTPPRDIHAHWDTPEQQPVNIEVLKSTERPDITPVFGTSTPPSGVSGAIRRLAFRFSENDVRRWMTLLFADRVNVVEGVVSDLAHGHVPNVLGEMGWRAELKHNPKGAARKAATVLAVAGVGYWLWTRRQGARRPLQRRSRWL
jgi:hypothetical protein